MAWCPNCSSEYLDHIKICKDCKIELEEGDPPAPEEKETDYEFMEAAHLTTASSDMEANILLGLLEANGIQAVKGYREAGDYLAIYMGDTSFGIDLYVDKEQLPLAKCLIEPMEEELDSSEEPPTEQRDKKSKWLQTSFVIFCVLIIIILRGIYFL